MLVEMQNSTATVENMLAFLIKLNIHLLYGPAVPFPRIYTNEIKKLLFVYKHANILVVSFINAQTQINLNVDKLRNKQ